MFEFLCGEDDKVVLWNLIVVIEKGVLCVLLYILFFELWFNFERKVGDEYKARAVEDRLKKFFFE